MKKTTYIPLFALISLLFLAITGCQSTTVQTPSVVQTDTLTLTLSKTQMPTETPTIPPTATITSTITPTFTETPAYNMPGLYNIYKCVDFKPTNIPYVINFCVQSVKVNDDRTMQFNVYWKTYVDTGGLLIKRSDVNNNNMFLYDNLQNQYLAIGYGGNAGRDAGVDKAPTAGWFLFPAPKPGATSFRFFDFDNHVSIDDIVLSPDKNVAPPTKTPTLDPNTKFNEPGTYTINKCASYPLNLVFAGATTVNLCLITVVINADYEMRFNLKWTAHFDQVMKTIKPSDAGNQNIILIDNLTNVYHHTQTGGCAAQETELFTGQFFGGQKDIDVDCKGWFQFPAAKPGATLFRFIYSDDQVVINNIVLAKKPG